MGVVDARPGQGAGATAVRSFLDVDGIVDDFTGWVQLIWRKLKVCGLGGWNKIGVKMSNLVFTTL